VRRKQSSGGPRLRHWGGQRGRMYGHGHGNVTARVRKHEGQKSNWVHFSRNAIEERRFIVTTTIVAFPTVPLLQQAGILYRRPFSVSKWRTKSVFHVWAKKGAHAHITTVKLGIRRALTHNHRFQSHTITLGGEETQIYILNNHSGSQHPQQNHIWVSRYT